MPQLAERQRQLTNARADNPWLAAGSVIVQQQAIRDHYWAMQGFFARKRGRPSWRKADWDEGFRIVTVKPGDVRRVNRHWGEVKIPKAGWVRFRWSRSLPEGAKSFRVTRDRPHRWHIAFAAIPPSVPAPENDEVVGIDRGVAVSAALSTGELLHCPTLTPGERERLARLERRLARAKRGSARRCQVKTAIARLKAHDTDRRRDWCEKISTDLARRFDVIRVENLKIKAMTRSAKGTREVPGRNVQQKARLNGEISKAGWGRLVQRLEEKAPGRVEKVNPAFTSQCCSVCGHVDRKSRASQALFRCTACGYTANADVNAARNIAAGHAVKARGGDRVAGPVNREPQLPIP
jgi:IS605 OrfB family transposase